MLPSLSLSAPKDLLDAVRRSLWRWRHHAVTAASRALGSAPSSPGELVGGARALTGRAHEIHKPRHCLLSVTVAGAMAGAPTLAHARYSLRTGSSGNLNLNLRFAQRGLGRRPHRR